MRKIQWPLIDCDGNLKINPEFRSDECLTFFPNGKMESNGGPVGHDEITEDQIDMLPESDQCFVREFMDGNYEITNS
jgi:hypothetical protein